MYFIFFRSDPWEKEMKDFETLPPSKRHEAEKALLRQIRGGLKLPHDLLPVGCIYDSGRDSSIFNEFIAIMRDCWRAQSVSAAYDVLEAFSIIRIQERPLMSSVWERIVQLHESCVKNNSIQ
jgi:hypothetical protein